jgi:hypothetical protein
VNSEHWTVEYRVTGTDRPWFLDVSAVTCHPDRPSAVGRAIEMVPLRGRDNIRLTQVVKSVEHYWWEP